MSKVNAIQPTSETPILVFLYVGSRLKAESTQMWHNMSLMFTATSAATSFSNLQFVLLPLKINFQSFFPNYLFSLWTEFLELRLDHI